MGNRRFASLPVRSRIPIWDRTGIPIFSIWGFQGSETAESGGGGRRGCPIRDPASLSAFGGYPPSADVIFLLCTQRDLNPPSLIGSQSFSLINYVCINPRTFSNTLTVLRLPQPYKLSVLPSPIPNPPPPVPLSAKRPRGIGGGGLGILKLSKRSPDHPTAPYGAEAVFVFYH